MRSGVESVEKRTPATPVAEDVLDILSKQITGGTFGEGFGPLQRESGTAIRQFVQGGGLDPERFASIAAPLVEQSERATERSAANLREGFGARGARFGTSAAQGEALLRSERGAGLDAALSDLSLRMGDQILRGIGQMQQIGMSNIAPFLQALDLGVLAPDTVKKPSLFSEILGPIAGLAQGIGEIVPG